MIESNMYKNPGRESLIISLMQIAVSSLNSPKNMASRITFNYLSKKRKA